MKLQEILFPNKPQDSYFIKPYSNIYEFYLSGDIEDPSNYIDWFNTIRNASDNDMIKIYINSRGGNADTALQFIRVLEESKAHVICSVEGSCMSAATMILLCCDSFEITEHSLFMFHNYSGAIFGKGGEIYDQAVFERAWSRSFLSKIYKDFLSSEEIESLLNNRDIWLQSDEVSARLKNLLKVREESIVERT